MKDFIFIYFGSLFIGSGTMAHSIRYKRISGIKLPKLFRICLFTVFIQNAKKETPIYKILVQVYYQMGNLYLVVSGQMLELPKQRMLMISYYCLAILTLIADYIILKYFYENRSKKIIFELFHCQIVENILIIVQAPANHFIVIDDIKEIRLVCLKEKFQLIIIKEDEKIGIDIKDSQSHVAKEYTEFKQILLEKNPLIKCC